MGRGPWKRQREVRIKFRKIAGDGGLGGEVSGEELPVAGGGRTPGLSLPSALSLFTAALRAGEGIQGQIW